jgi:hypothetical protein
MDKGELAGEPERNDHSESRAGPKDGAYHYQTREKKGVESRAWVTKYITVPWQDQNMKTRKRNFEHLIFSFLM